MGVSRPFRLRSARKSLANSHRPSRQTPRRPASPRRCLQRRVPGSQKRGAHTAISDGNGVLLVSRVVCHVKPRFSRLKVMCPPGFLAHLMVAYTDAAQLYCSYTRTNSPKLSHNLSVSSPGTHPLPLIRGTGYFSLCLSLDRSHPLWWQTVHSIFLAQHSFT